ncbi:hypothetical protein [Elongatibacter sediminis]|uniref:Uncharacterized protein n=1 Tax=Elongatibacter sediminis TaxID=3119006 RepID=A0AAW9RA73_9GAMM
MTIVTALIFTIISQRVFAIDLVLMLIDLVSVDVTVWVRFFCHIPQAFGAHEKHCYGK